MSENKNAKTPADGPVAWGCQCGRAYTVTCISSKPPKREWVGLTDEDMEALFLNEDGVRFARYIEAKLKEKNGGEYRNGATTERTKLKEKNA